MASIKQYFLWLAILSPAFFSCKEPTSLAFTGGLKGKISIGPLCPVETVPPQPGCEPTAQTFITGATAVWNLNKTTKLVTLNPSLDGNYLISLPAGKYIIDMENPQTYRAGSNLPAEITVIKDDTTIFNINIDTGIR